MPLLSLFSGCFPAQPQQQKKKQAAQPALLPCVADDERRAAEADNTMLVVSVDKPERSGGSASSTNSSTVPAVASPCSASVPAIVGAGVSSDTAAAIAAAAAAAGASPTRCASGTLSRPSAGGHKVTLYGRYASQPGARHSALLLGEDASPELAAEAAAGAAAASAMARGACSLDAPRAAQPRFCGGGGSGAVAIAAWPQSGSPGGSSGRGMLALHTAVHAHHLMLEGSPPFAHGLSPRHSLLFKPRPSGESADSSSQGSSRRSSAALTVYPQGVLLSAVPAVTGLEHMSRMLQLATKGKPLAEAMAERRAMAKYMSTGVTRPCVTRPTLRAPSPCSARAAGPAAVATVTAHAALVLAQAAAPVLAAP